MNDIVFGFVVGWGGATLVSSILCGIMMKKQSDVYVRSIDRICDILCDKYNNDADWWKE